MHYVININVHPLEVEGVSRCCHSKLKVGKMRIYLTLDQIFTNLNALSYNIWILYPLEVLCQTFAKQYTILFPIRVN